MVLFNVKINMKNNHCHLPLLFDSQRKSHWWRSKMLSILLLFTVALEHGFLGYALDTTNMLPEDEIPSNDIQKVVRILMKEVDLFTSQMNSHMSEIHTSLDKMNGRMDQVSKDVEDISEKVEFYHPSWVYYPPGTKTHRARRYYSEYKLEFVGFGLSTNDDG